MRERKRERGGFQVLVVFRRQPIDLKYRGIPMIDPPLLAHGTYYRIFNRSCVFFFWRMSARILLQVPKMEERPRWERSGALKQQEARTRSRRYRAREGSARERGWERARGVRPPLSMLRGEFETVVSMLMSVPRFFVRGRLARPLNYFKYFQMSVGGGGGRT